MASRAAFCPRAKITIAASKCMPFNMPFSEMSDVLVLISVYSLNGGSYRVDVTAWLRLRSSRFLSS